MNTSNNLLMKIIRIIFAILAILYTMSLIGSITTNKDTATQESQVIWIVIVVICIVVIYFTTKKIENRK